MSIFVQYDLRLNYSLIRILRFGWFGFNGGSALNASMRAMVAVWNTNLAASTAVIGWQLYHYILKGRKFSVVGACEGVIAGLVGVTPAAGYVSPWCAAAIGFITSLVCCAFENFNRWIGIDDGLEVFKLHGIGGMCGAFLTGIFATAGISSLDGIPTIASGAVDGNGIQVAKQLAEIAAIFAWSFVCSVIMLMALKYTPGMHLRVSDDIEEIGLDHDQFDDETAGEWGMYDTEEGHKKRDSLVLHGVPQAASASTNGAKAESGNESKDDDRTVEERQY